MRSKYYESRELNEWDEFIDASNNGTVFQKQSFITYHIDRKFIDHSLIIKNNSAPKIKYHKKLIVNTIIR